MNFRTCVVCGKTYPPGTGCTNRCCESCHRRFCTKGGITYQGHGLDVAKARAEVAKKAPPGL